MCEIAPLAPGPAGPAGPLRAYSSSGSSATLYFLSTNLSEERILRRDSEVCRGMPSRHAAPGRSSLYSDSLKLRKTHACPERLSVCQPSAALTCTPLRSTSTGMAPSASSSAGSAAPHRAPPRRLLGPPAGVLRRLPSHCGAPHAQRRARSRCCPCSLRAAAPPVLEHRPSGSCHRARLVQVHQLERARQVEPDASD